MRWDSRSTSSKKGSHSVFITKTLEDIYMVLNPFMFVLSLDYG